MTTTYTHDFTCKFDLRMYPLDTQKCSMEIKLIDSKEDLFDLKLTDLKLYGLDYANQYLIHDPRLDQTQSTSKKLHIEIIMERQKIYSLLTTILPAILINLVKSYLTTFYLLNICRYFILQNSFWKLQVCIASNYFTEGHFEAVITVNLTGLLVLATMFNDASAG